MFIEKLTISGIRSYKTETVIDDLSGNLNAIVGNNGTGKSSIFIALSLIFNLKSMKHLNKVTRRQIISNGKAQGSVEVILANEDGRIPIGTLKVTIKRTLKDSWDQFTVNDKIMKTDQVKDLLSAAGFTPENPYNIVEQGQISSVAGLCAEQLLGIIHDTAGVTNHKQAEKEIIRGVEKNEMCFMRAEGLSQQIFENSDTVRNTVADGKRHAKITREVSAINYILCDRDVRDNTAKLSKREVELIKFNDKRENVFRKRDGLVKVLEGYKNMLRMAEMNHEIASSNKISVQEELDKIHADCARMQLALNDFKVREDEKKKEEELLEKLQRELEEGKAKLQKVAEEVDQLKTEFHSFAEKEKSLKDRQSFLRSKAHLLDEFATVKDRDDFILKTVEEIKKAKKDTEDECSGIQTYIDNETPILTKLEVRIKEKQEAETRLLSIHLKSDDDMKKLKCEELKVQNDFRSKLQSVFDKSLELTASKTKAKRFLSQKLPVSVSKVYENVELVLNDVTNGIQGDHFLGMVADTFTCDANLSIAVDIVAGLKLFRYVVSDDKSVTKFMKCWNEKNMEGELYFIALNRLQKRKPLQIRDTRAIPLIAKLNFVEMYADLMKTIFGNTMLCNSLDDCCTIAKTYHVDCVTVDGDFVCSNGALSGGYFSISNSKLKNYKEYREMSANIKILEREYGRNKKEADDLVKHLEKFQSDFQSQERCRSELGRIKQNLESLKREKEVLENNITKLKSNLHDRKKDICMHDRQIHKFEEELNKEPGECSLTVEEQLEFREMAHCINSLKIERMAQLQRLSDAQKEKCRLQDGINQQLKMKIRKVTKKIEEFSKIENSNDLLTVLEKQRDNITTKFKEIVKDVDVSYHDMDLQKNRILDINDNISTFFHLDDDMQQLEEINKRIARSRKKVDDATNRKFSTCAPTQALLDKYSPYTNHRLFRKRRELQALLERLGEPNLKAVKTASTMETELRTLEHKLAEKRQDDEALAEILNLEERAVKMATHSAYRHVAFEFGRIFESFVPNGRGTISFFRDEKVVDILGAPEEFDVCDSIQINVNFHNRDELLSSCLRSLSGGQRAIATLAFMFAVQSYSGVPFYLFDEIDQHLDERYAKNVTDYIRNHLKDVQVIASTFKRPFVNVADKLYCISMVHGNSHVRVVSKEEATGVIDARRARSSTRRRTAKGAQN